MILGFGEVRFCTDCRCWLRFHGNSIHLEAAKTQRPAGSSYMADNVIVGAQVGVQLRGGHVVGRDFQILDTPVAFEILDGATYDIAGVIHTSGR